MLEAEAGTVDVVDFLWLRDNAGRWDAERWQIAREEEYAELTKEDYEKFHIGIREHLGEAGAQTFFEERDSRRTELNLDQKPPAPDRRVPPNFINTLRRARTSDGGFKEWGYVIFRTAGYGNDDVVAEVKMKIHAAIEQQFEDSAKRRVPEVVVDIPRAKESFQLKWIEAEDLDGVSPAEVARRYRSLRGRGRLNLNLCLCLDEPSIRSIQMPAPALAHVLAVARGCGQELSPDEVTDEGADENWTGSFKVGVNVLISELYPKIGYDMLTPYEIGIGVTPDLVWTGLSRSFGDPASAW